MSEPTTVPDFPPDKYEVVMEWLLNTTFLDGQDGSRKKWHELSLAAKEEVELYLVGHYFLGTEDLAIVSNAATVLTPLGAKTVDEVLALEPYLRESA